MANAPINATRGIIPQLRLISNRVETTGMDSSLEDHHTLGLALGSLATICFTMQYAPQAVKNYNRRSVTGFSTTGIVIKLVGAAFLMVNTLLMGEPLPVVLYGAFNVIQHSVFIYQFFLYADSPDSRRYLVWLLFPIIPLSMGILFPSSIYLTNSIKPLAQLISHLPQLSLCIREKSVRGVSMVTQHLNVLGGLSGLFMCFLIRPKSVTTYFIYANSCFQAVSLYLVAYYYEGPSALELELITRSPTKHTMEESL